MPRKWDFVAALLIYYARECSKTLVYKYQRKWNLPLFMANWTAVQHRFIESGMFAKLLFWFFSYYKAFQSFL